MKYVARRDYSLGTELAYDENKKQQVIIKYTGEKVIKDEIVTYAKVIGKTDRKTYSTDFRNLSNIGVK